MALTQATIYGRYALETLRAADLRIAMATVDLFDDTAERRIVRMLRVHAPDRATLETRTLTGYDAERNRWTHYGPGRGVDVEGRAAVRAMVRAMLAEVDAAKLTPSVHNSGAHESFYRET